MMVVRRIKKWPKSSMELRSVKTRMAIRGCTAKYLLVGATLE